MSAPSESAASPAPCACTNISLMQLFHELKQKFPGVPDHVVSHTIELYCHDKQACETHLHSEVKASLTHAYHASSSAAARRLSQLKLNPPLKCRNQPITKHEVSPSTPIKSIVCQGPQKAIISTAEYTDEKENTPNTDANQNIVEPKNEDIIKVNNNSSPVTVINIDNCYPKYNADSPSDLELTNENIKEENTNTSVKDEKVSTHLKENNSTCTKENVGIILTETKDLEQSESTNYRIHKSNKIKSNLPERLEKGKEKKTIKKEEKLTTSTQPKRPNTLNFIKVNPDIAFNQTLKEPESTCRTVSPIPPRNDTQENISNNPYRQERAYPLNVSVNVNCHMDLSHNYDPWIADFDSPRTITSVNLTVCTPTSNMASPVRESREDDGGFEGHVTVTVSPSTTRPRRRAPAPPSNNSRIESPRPVRTAPEPPGSNHGHDWSLIERQKERLNRLAMALSQEKGSLAQLTRETNILAGPPPTRSESQRLRDYVERLRDQCDTLAKRLEMAGNEAENSGNFYSNIYTGQRPSSSWQCHMCTFRNHPLLDKCEECDMPRIFVVRAPDGITVRLGRRKIARSWVL